MFTSHKQISPPSLVLKLKISEVSQKWIPKAVELKRIPTHKKCKCKKFCSQTRLVGEIYSSDVIMHRGYYCDHFTFNGVLASSLNLLYRFLILSPRTSGLGTDNLLKERGLETIEWRDTWSAGLFLCTCSIRFVDLASILKVSNGFKLASLKVWRSFIYYASW